MKTKTAFLVILLAFALTFANITPSRAQGEEPPADAAADIVTIQPVVAIPGLIPTYDMVSYGAGDENALFFSGWIGGETELYAYSPNFNPTVLNINVNPTGSSVPDELTVFNGALYFIADGGDGAGRELWKFDWANGAQRVADIVPGAADSNPIYLTVFNNELYFNMDRNDGAGYELWKYNANGTHRVVDIIPGPISSSPAYLAVYNGSLYFRADGADGVGDELWMYAPATGTQRVVDIYSGSGSSYPAYLTVYDGALYFTADGNDGAGNELWMYDSINGAQRVADISSGTADSTLVDLTVYNGALYFHKRILTNGGSDSELWKYDPVNGADFVNFNGDTNFEQISIYNDALYFLADDGSGDAIWMYNNTTAAAFRSVKSYDGWVLESGETSNAGGTINANATTFNLGDNAQDKQYRSILSFNTSTLPDNAVIISATLKIRKQGSTGTNPFTTHGNIIVDIRKGPFGGGNALQAGDFQATPSRANVGIFKNLPYLNQWFMSALKTTSFPFINAAGVTQFRLRFATDDNNDNGADFLRFFSADGDNMSNYPSLEVKYYLP